MPHNPIERLRSLLMFVIAWLIAVYVYEVVKASFQTGVGVAAAVGTGFLNLYARRRAEQAADRTWAFRFWLYLPAILFLAVPLAVRAVSFFSATRETGWWEQVQALLPFVLKLGVPVAILLWVYWRLSSWAGRANGAPDGSD